MAAGWPWRRSAEPWFVELDLFGIEDQGAMDKLRGEATGLWMEEPAPAAVMETSSGLSETAWGIGLTSLGDRLPSHHHPAIMTLNYPDEDHWTWRRFVTRRQPGTAFVRVPKGERASAEDRARWAEALEGSPDLRRRLIDGEPGLVVMGEGVAQGYSESLHVAPDLLTPVPNIELVIGWDSGHWPTTIIGQLVEGAVHVYASLVTPHAGTRQHIEQALLPWLERHAPWGLRGVGLVRHYVDPSMNTRAESDTDQSAVLVIRRLLGGAVRDGAVSWPARRDPLLVLLNRLVRGRGALQINPTADTEPVRRALSGRWFYPRRSNGEVLKDLPEKNHPWSDVGDALCYLVGGLAPSRAREREGARPMPRRALTSTSPGPFHRELERVTGPTW